MQEQRGPDGLRLAELLVALSTAQDLGVGFPRGYVFRTCIIATRIAEALGVSLAEQRDVFYAALLAHGGCTCYTAQIAAFIRGDERTARRDLVFLGDYTDQQEVLRWVKDFVGATRPVMERAGRVVDFMFHGRDFFREGFASAGEVARRLAQRLGLPDSASNALPSLFEHWDGGGLPLGLRGEAIPLVARIVGASIYLAGWHMQGGRDAARHIARNRSGTAFDPMVVGAFLRIAQQEGFWRGLEQGDVGENAVALEPGAPLPAGEDALDAAALTLADFVDMKAFYLAGRSRRVADLARAVGGRLGLAEGRTLWRAGLMHDCGHVAATSPRPRSSSTNPTRTSAKRNGRRAAGIPSLRAISSPRWRRLPASGSSSRRITSA
ncbi:MAG: HD domain-containing protein [Chloroflexi bacterium]|nr:HD domain-containing protein [Chloroflexota bacterium]